MTTKNLIIKQDRNGNILKSLEIMKNSEGKIILIEFKDLNLFGDIERALLSEGDLKKCLEFLKSEGINFN